MMQQPIYRRVLLKLSGEVLTGEQSFGIDQKACLTLARQLAGFHQAGIECAVVIGGGNIFRGLDLKSAAMPRTPADHMGMLATLLNGIALQQALSSLNIPVSLMSAIECPQIAESYHWSKAIAYLKEKKVLLFVGGTGNPYFTTDTAAALRASEMDVDVLIKATKVEGIYNKDPLKYKEAVKYQTLSYSQILAEKLQVMDATAVALCRSNQIPIFVFNMHRLKSEPVNEILSHKEKGTWVSGD